MYAPLDYDTISEWKKLSGSSTVRSWNHGFQLQLDKALWVDSELWVMEQQWLKYLVLIVTTQSTQTLSLIKQRKTEEKIESLQMLVEPQAQEIEDWFILHQHFNLQQV